MIHVGTLPSTYRASVNWYVSDWDRGYAVHLFNTKEEAIEYAETIEAEGRAVCVDWFNQNGSPKREISSISKFIDHRGGVMLCGDPRQTIYGFAGAKVTDDKCYEKVGDLICEFGIVEVLTNLSKVLYEVPDSNSITNLAKLLEVMATFDE